METVSVAGRRYSWSQTKQDLTLLVQLPPDTSARSVRCEVRGEAIQLWVGSANEPLLAGTLHDKICNSVWTVDAGQLNLELEKARARFWPSALQGDPEVDIKALISREKAEREPAYKMPPGEEMKPRKVTDRETLSKLKAEFPQLAIDLGGPDAHVAQHQQYVGPRKQFDWGPVDANFSAATATPPPPAAAPSSLASHAASQPSCGAVESLGAAPAAEASAPAEAGEAGRAEPEKYVWGTIPAEERGAAGAAPSTSSPEPATFSWGPVPLPRSTPVASVAAPEPGAFSWGPLPGE